MPCRSRSRRRRPQVLTEETLALPLEYSAQSETEARALAAMRKFDFSSLLAFVEMMEALAQARQIKLNRKTAYSR